MKKQVPKIGILDATVDSQRGLSVVLASLYNPVSSFSPPRVPGLRTGKNDTIRVAPQARVAPEAPLAVTANRWEERRVGNE